MSLEERIPIKNKEKKVKKLNQHQGSSIVNNEKKGHEYRGSSMAISEKG
jgi:hypothetical protein